MTKNSRARCPRRTARDCGSSGSGTGAPQTRLPEDSAPATSPRQTTERKARVSGLFKFSDRIFYSVNPRSDQMQTPLGVTKLDPDILRNFTKQAANPARWRFTPRSCSQR